MGSNTEPSIYHSETLRVIFFVHRDPEDKDQSLVLIYDDRYPFDEK